MRQDRLGTQEQELEERRGTKQNVAIGQTQKVRPGSREAFKRMAQEPRNRRSKSNTHVLDLRGGLPRGRKSVERKGLGVEK